MLVNPSDSLNFYDIDINYINYLKNFEPKVPDIKYNKHDKFMCGVVLKIDDIDYFAPISSFCDKQRTNFIILNENGRPISSIRFSFMLPAHQSLLKLRDFSKEDEKYRYLLLQEYKYCNKHKEEIYRKARYVYKRVISGYDKMMAKNCCNFKLLESKYREYLLHHIDLSEIAATNEKTLIKSRLNNIRYSKDVR